ncbi:hypothetical protein [Micromonospora psammae]|uniref:hypothetical protein n=1 Tax=Micromonospora sp. CPCC 205556 TaxID=3122398 RepID=UPI002FF418CA
MRKAASPAITRMATQLIAAGRGLADRDAPSVHAALRELREMGGDLARLSDALQGAREVVQLSPQRRRWRNSLQQYSEGAEHLNKAVLASRGLTRKSVALIANDEQIPPLLPDAVTTLGLAVRDLNEDFIAGREPHRTRQRSLVAVCQASEAHRTGLGLSGTAVVALVRTVAGELLRATAIERTDANRMVRQAAS